ncbi:hypothetical protein ACGFSB_06940 [Streptomyces sp. NPDC048441]|uniref:hypothetical protein n=1 Tax=Streptomyces sp. NPDC048441 TaxID=3365552 RepID=UPI0037160260
MKPQVNIVAVVDVIGALSGSTLLDGNLCMMDDGGHDSAHQGTPNLCTIVKPGQVVSWSALALDLQTPVEIKSISFVPDQSAEQSASEHSTEDDKQHLDVWSGVVPNWLTPGVPYKYRLEFQMYEGGNSVMHIDTPALMCQ